MASEKAAVEDEGDVVGENEGGRASHAVRFLRGRWMSPEFLVYYVVLLYGYAYVIFRGWTLSSSLVQANSAPSATAIAAGIDAVALQPGWLIPGRAVDLSDAQWRTFRAGLPKLVTVLALFAVVSRGARAAGGPPAALAVGVVFGIASVAFLHGAKSIFLLSAALTYWVLARCVAGVPWLGPGVLWAAACGSWLAIQAVRGGSFAALNPAWAWLDAWGGPVRWHVGFNLVLLRMLSYGLDLHWQRTGATPVRPGLPESRRLAEMPRSPPEYGVIPYLTYLLYPPLYLTGPTITFNAWAAQLAAPQMTALQPGRIVVYAARLVGCLILLELLTHAIYANAIASRASWRALGLSAPELGLVGYWVLNFMWLKFLVIWRLARLASLAAGCDPPENMLRCVNDNYDIEGFWKHWHASYNLWLVRYLYVPLGGSRTRAANIWVVFTFVALWHDVEPRLLAWAWLMCAFFLPEMLAKALASRADWAPFRAKAAYRQLRAAAAALNILLLMAANIVGFVIGLDGLKSFLTEMLTWSSMPFCGAMALCFYAAAQIMFEFREVEDRKAKRAHSEAGLLKHAHPH